MNSFGSGVHVSVFCHSYGSVVCGRAAPAMQVSDIVVFGSPGMDVSSVNDLGTTAKVWATRARSDWIRYVPHVRVDGYGHGADPAGPSFGSTLFRSDGVTAHGYVPARVRRTELATNRAARSRRPRRPGA